MIYRLVSLQSDELICTSELVGDIMDVIVESFRICITPGDGSLTVTSITNLLQKQPKTSGYTYSSISVLVSGFVVLLSTAIKNRTKLSVVGKDMKAMNFRSDVIKILEETLRSNRLLLEKKFIDNRVRAVRLTNFRFRVDVSISTDSLQKVFKPTILTELSFSNGTTRTFELPVEKFHNLRYSVAKVLRNMEEVERHPIMKLAFLKDMEKFEKVGGD